MKQNQYVNYITAEQVLFIGKFLKSYLVSNIFLEYYYEIVCTKTNNILFPYIHFFFIPLRLLR